VCKSYEQINFRSASHGTLTSTEEVFKFFMFSEFRAINGVVYFIENVFVKEL
jgi:hypothetical protein